MASHNDETSFNTELAAQKLEEYIEEYNRVDRLMSLVDYLILLHAKIKGLIETLIQKQPTLEDNAFYIQDTLLLFETLEREPEIFNEKTVPNPSFCFFYALLYAGNLPD